MLAVLAPFFNPRPTIFPAKPIDNVSNTAIGIAYAVALVLALLKNSGSDIRFIKASSSFISTPEDFISSLIISPNIVPKVTVPPAPAPTKGLPLKKVVPINVASDGADTASDSPTTDKTAFGFLTIAFSDATNPSASCISLRPSCIFAGASGYILSSSSIVFINFSGDFNLSCCCNTLNDCINRPYPRLRAKLGAT